MQNFAFNFNENVKKIIHTCNVETININREITISNSMFVEPTTENEIFNILNNLNVRKSSGDDGIRPKDIKCNAIVLTPIVTSLVNQSISTATIPKQLKQVRKL